MNNYHDLTEFRDFRDPPKKFDPKDKHNHIPWDTRFESIEDWYNIPIKKEGVTYVKYPLTNDNRVWVPQMDSTGIVHIDYTLNRTWSTSTQLFNSSISTTEITSPIIDTYVTSNSSNSTIYYLNSNNSILSYDPELWRDTKKNVLKKYGYVSNVFQEEHGKKIPWEKEREVEERKAVEWNTKWTLDKILSEIYYKYFDTDNRLSGMDDFYYTINDLEIVKDRFKGRIPWREIGFINTWIELEDEYLEDDTNMPEDAFFLHDVSWNRLLVGRT